MKQEQFLELPDVKTQLRLTAIIVGCYVVIAVFGMAANANNMLSEPCKTLATQCGVMLIFVAGLLSSLDFFWIKNITHNKSLATRQKSDAQYNLVVFNERELETPGKFTSNIEIQKERVAEADLELDKIDQYPKTIITLGKFSFLLLSIGTLLCLLGA